MDESIKLLAWKRFFKSILCTSVCLALLSACSESNTQAPSIPTVAVTKISSSQIPINRKYIGITQSISAAGIKARVEGFLIKMNFVEGKPVKKDQLLFVIDPRPFEAKLSLAQGQYAKSVADKEYQEIQYRRMKDLVVKGDVSQSHFDEVNAKFSEADAQVQIGAANVADAKINLGYCYMYSPFDGIIGKKYVDVGNLVGGGENTLLANVVQLNPIYVEFSPSVEDFTSFLKYRDNMPFKVEVSLPHDGNLVFKGKLDLINNQADVSTSTILMRAEIENPKQLLLPGIYVSVKLHLSNNEKVILVPKQATMVTQGQRSVFVVGSDNIVHSKNITTSGQYDSSYIVSSGLKEGEVVVSNGLQKIHDGMKVQPEKTKVQDAVK
ncbi:efflux RND transporter periplasmic adaptor subunit [Legionella sp. 16cNR16C]|uniref:efflux RND transporter periplasmic adaptor subunit n=1 Tax=Legionella sp. 16cNR16C TaxID=2905656 RepID=UPI001E3CFF2E|nr:efflux RND transporter periplasmic adaptor subunit [Legionella sp. 16cNR16C]MCE3044769.1 efflux RND transporter periplasmic adaptor subunit [Legionella sp. 16cNR16C]